MRVNEEVVPLLGGPPHDPDELLRVVPGLYRVAFALTGTRQDAEDLVHTAVERYLATTRVAPDDLAAYLRRTMTNLHLNAVKRRGVHGRSLTTLRGDRQAPPADLTVRPDIFTALQALAPLPRAVVVLRYLADQSVDDVARTLGRPAGTVRRLAHHALADLRLSPALQPIDEVPDDLNDDERELSARLHRAADELDVPAGLLLRVRATAERQPGPPVDAGRRAKWLMPVLAAAAVVAGLVLFAVTPRHGVTVPAVVQPAMPPSSTGGSAVPDRRTPVSVVNGYLTTARAGKCEQAAAMYWVPGVAGQPGDLCEFTISDFDVSQHDGPTATANSDVVSALLTTEGSDDETVPAGRIVWFYQLERQPDGTWRITEGGSGP